MQKYKKIYAICLFTLLGTMPQTSWAEIVDGVPIPPKRPDVMSVSPAYIEYLKNKTKGIEYNEPQEQEQKPTDKPPEQPSPLKQKSVTNIDSETALKNINTNDILSALSGDINLSDAPPIPAKKPLLLSSAEHMNNVKTQAGEEIEEETTLVSFALKPGEIHINADIERFLKEHALQLFKEDKNIIMQIHAYATPIDNTEYSDVRLSLARALEVRSFLIKNNIEPTRLKLSPMGADDQNNSDDRIDLIFIEQKS